MRLPLYSISYMNFREFCELRRTPSMRSSVLPHRPAPEGLTYERP
jgi:hypothetical protein